MTAQVASGGIAAYQGGCAGEQAINCGEKMRQFDGLSGGCPGVNEKTSEHRFVGPRAFNDEDGDLGFYFVKMPGKKDRCDAERLHINEREVDFTAVEEGGSSPIG